MRIANDHASFKRLLSNHLKPGPPLRTIAELPSSTLWRETRNPFKNHTISEFQPSMNASPRYPTPFDNGVRIELSDVVQKGAPYPRQPGTGLRG